MLTLFLCYPLSSNFFFLKKKKNYSPAGLTQKKVSQEKICPNSRRQCRKIFGRHSSGATSSPLRNAVRLVCYFGYKISTNSKIGVFWGIWAKILIFSPISGLKIGFLGQNFVFVGICKPPQKQKPISKPLKSIFKYFLNQPAL